MARIQILLFTIALVACLLSVAYAEECNPKTCVSIVSKCQIQDKCACDMNDTGCIDKCRRCLGNLYNSCCSCVGAYHSNTNGFYLYSYMTGKKRLHTLRETDFNEVSSGDF